MAVILVTYDLKKPGRNYQPVWDYLKTFTYCKGLESVWLLDTAKTTVTIRDELMGRIDDNDMIFVVRLQRDWSAYNYSCADWLNSAQRSW